MLRTSVLISDKYGFPIKLHAVCAHTDSFPLFFLITRLKRNWQCVYGLSKEAQRGAFSSVSLQKTGDSAAHVYF